MVRIARRPFLRLAAARMSVRASGNWHRDCAVLPPEADNARLSGQETA